MENIIGKGISGKYYIYFSWSYFYGAGYLFCKKIYLSLNSELNKFKQIHSADFCC